MLTPLTLSGLSEKGYVQVSYYFNENNKVMNEALLESRKLMHQRKIETDQLLMQFLKFLVVKLPSRNRKFSIASGRIKSRRLKPQIFISIQNPFVKMLNEGITMRNEAKFVKLIYKLKEMLKHFS